MASSLPPERQEGCIWITKEDGWALRETILPFELPKNSPEVADATERLSTAIYEALLRIEVEGRGGMNIEITDVMALVINSRVKSGMWKGADLLLIQSWMVLHEQHYATVPLQLPATIPLVLEEGPSDAVHNTGEAERSGDGDAAVSFPNKRRRPQLRADPARSGLHPDEGGELPDVLRN